MAAVHNESEVAIHLDKCLLLREKRNSPLGDSTSVFGPQPDV
jgi:hypothetical protein